MLLIVAGVFLASCSEHLGPSLLGWVFLICDISAGLAKLGVSQLYNSSTGLHKKVSIFAGHVVSGIANSGMNFTCHKDTKYSRVEQPGPGIQHLKVKAKGVTVGLSCVRSCLGEQNPSQTES